MRRVKKKDQKFSAMCQGLLAQHPDMSPVEAGQTIYDGLQQANGKKPKKRDTDIPPSASLSTETSD